MGGWVGPSTGKDDMEKRKFLALPGPDPVTSRYTDCAIPALFQAPVSGQKDRIVLTENRY
jgi:hypothetical protein